MLLYGSTGVNLHLSSRSGRREKAMAWFKSVFSFDDWNILGVYEIGFASLDARHLSSGVPCRQWRENY